MADPTMLDLLGVPRPPRRKRRKLLRMDDAGDPGIHVQPCTVCGFVGWVACSDRVARRGIPCPVCDPCDDVRITIRESAGPRAELDVWTPRCEVDR